jgi:hypothetical protein
MSAKLFRKGSIWVVRALVDHCFREASEARAWAKANHLRLIRARADDRAWTVRQD